MQASLQGASPPSTLSNHAADASIATRLRLETRADHEAIEANPRLRRMMADDLRVSEYVAILFRLAGFHEPLEHGLRRWSHRFPDSLDLRARLIKTRLLRRDLWTLAPDLGFDIQACEALGDFSSIEAAWGCLYVIEGSTLGGQLIARHLEATMGLTAGRGAAFHLPYGPRTGALWQGFKAALIEEVARAGLNADGIVAGARATFKAMDAWLASDVNRG